MSLFATEAASRDARHRFTLLRSTEPVPMS